MLTAMMAVWNMQGASHDIWDVNTDFDYHEEQRLDEAPRRRPARRDLSMMAGHARRRRRHVLGERPGLRPLHPRSSSARWSPLAPEHEFVCFLDARAAERVRPARAERPRRRGRRSARVAHRGRGGRRLPLARPTCCAWPAPSRASASTCSSRRRSTPTFPCRRGSRAVVTMHDAIAERFPRLTLPTPAPGCSGSSRWGSRSGRRGCVLTVSDFAARDIARHPRRAGRAGSGSRSRRRRATFRPSDKAAGHARAAAAALGLPHGARWFTYVGGFNPHKNVDVLVRRARRWRATPPSARRILRARRRASKATSSTATTCQIRGSHRAGGTEALVHWTGFLPDEDMRHLHSGAIALALPSENEGFGLPAIEAAACGAPVIATTASPLPELLEGGGLFVPPRDARR